MSKSRRDWRVSPQGDLALTLEVDVNGETLRVTSVQSHYETRFGGPPPVFIEREMRRKLMHEVEQRLLGPMA